MLRSLVRTHRLPVPPEAVSDRLTAAIEHERARLRARGVPHPEVRIERIWAKLFPGRGREELRRIAVEYELVVNPVWPAPGCRRLLGYLRGLPVALGLISNAQFYTPLLFHALLGADPAGLGFSSRLCLYSYTLGTAKPDPALFETAAARLADIGVRREETLVVGDDMASDIEPAVRLGFLTVLIGSVSPGTAAPPHAWISRLDSLRSLIEDARPLR